MHQATLQEFQREVKSLINKLNIDDETNIPDYILASYLTDSLLKLSSVKIFLDAHDKEEK